MRDAANIFVIGYPSALGGAGTELWATLKLWRGAGANITLIPTWSVGCGTWKTRTDEIGCVTHQATPDTLRNVPGIEGATVVSFCNQAFLRSAVAPLRELGCRLVWVNCMTFLFAAERTVYQAHGPFDAHVFQSQFARDREEPELAKYGYTPDRGHLIRGAFDLSGWEFAPREHARGTPFVVGRAARDSREKWSSNTWPIYNRIQVKNKRAVMLGYGANVTKKCGKPPKYATVHGPGKLDSQEFFRQLHATLPVNGGARENWPRAGLEAMACGVPVVAQNQWGWREMIRHGETGFLADNDEELAHFTAVLAYDEPRRLEMAHAARQRLENELANPDVIWGQWAALFASLDARKAVAA